ncbi:MAG: hypothetical protein C4586_05135 [Anaerolineaceae bacterium]|nr:MAG: hypothetical protein C4586_05135 [Anaerolineaceae bacterium]
MTRFDLTQNKKNREQMVKGLTTEQICEINAYLDSLGEYGEIHLVVQRGELRYINTVASHKAAGVNQGQEKVIYKT